MSETWDEAQRSRSHPHLHSIFQSSLWIHDLLSDSSVGGLEPVILFLLGMIDDVLGKHHEGLQYTVSPSCTDDDRGQGLTLIAS